MTSKIDVVAGVQAIRQHLRDHNFHVRDADPSDYQFGTDPGLRFKLGTVYGEVTITVWRFAKQIAVIRALNEAQIIEAKYEIDEHITTFFAGRRA